MLFSFIASNQLRIEAELVEIREEGCRIEGTVTVGDKKIADIRLMFAHINQKDEGSEKFVFTNGFLKSFLRTTLKVPVGGTKDA